MKHYNTDAEALKDNLRIQTRLFIALFVLAIIASCVSYCLGSMDKEAEIRHRAIKIMNNPKEKTAYSIQDIEIIVFGEPQL